VGERVDDARTGTGVRPGPGLEPWLWGVFAASGFAALIYQVVWQRSLLAIYGVHAESVAVVVTAFLLGLGLGSLLGGRLSTMPRVSPLLLFASVETGIGLYGAVSLPIFHAVGERTLLWPPIATAAVTFLLVLGPTLLMGATLPLLVAHGVRRSGNVGRSVGALYFVNTVGSACASFAAVFVLMYRLGQTGSVRAAAAVNLCVGLFVFARWLLARRAAA